MSYLKKTYELRKRKRTRWEGMTDAIHPLVT